jgi:hypothetical protein
MYFNDCATNVTIANSNAYNNRFFKEILLSTIEVINILIEDNTIDFKQTIYL